MCGAQCSMKASLTECSVRYFCLPYLEYRNRDNYDSHTYKVKVDSS